MIWVNWKRNSISKVLKLLNEMNLAIVKKNCPVKYRQERNRIHLFSMGLLTTFCLLAIFICIGFYAQFLINGNAPYHIVFASNRLARHLQFLLQFLVMVWSTLHYCPFINILIEIFLRVSLNYRVLTTHFRSIRKWRRKSDVNRNFVRFKIAMKEFNELQSVMEDINGVFSYYIAAFLMHSINTTAFIVVNFVGAKSFVEALAFLPIFLWQISFLVMFCPLAERLSESVST